MSRASSPLQRGSQAGRGYGLRDAIQRIALGGPAMGDRESLRELGRRGWTVNSKRVYRLMREDNLLRVRKRKFVITTDSNHGRRVSPNLAASMVLTGVDQLWRADVQYVRLREEFVFLAVILDAFSRRVIGWALDRNMEDELTLTALRMALSRRSIQPGLVHHSDRGSQYASNDYTDLLKAHGIDISMSRKGNPWDNAACESCMKTLKYEGFCATNIATWPGPRLDPRVPGKGHNQTRLHSALGYLPPVEFEAQLNAKNMEAAARQRVALSFQGIGNLSSDVRCKGSGINPPPRRSSASMSSSRLFPGELLRARFCFTGRDQNGIKWSCRSRILQRTANSSPNCLSPARGQPQIGTYHGVSKPQLQVYLDEFVFRHNRRKTPAAAFQTLLGLGTGRESTQYEQIRGAKDLNRNPLGYAESTR